MNGSRVAIVGCRGRLGTTLLSEWSRKYQIAPYSRQDLDFADPDQIEKSVESIRADWVVNCAGMTSLEECEEKPDVARAVNAESVGILARHCRKHGMRLVHFSTDYVFDGSKTTPYLEEDPARPLGAYGESKLEGEGRTLDASSDHFVFRISWVFGPGRPAFPDAMISKATKETEVCAVSDKWASPTSALDVAGWVESVMKLPHAEGGLYHLSNSGVCSWQEYAQHSLDVFLRLGGELKTQEVLPLKLSELDLLSAPRPVYSAMNTGKFSRLVGFAPRPWQEALEEYLEVRYSPVAD